MRQSSMPTAVGMLGYGGLIPFIGLATLANIEPSHGILYRGALLLYGAVILSFVGAIHWGVAMMVTDLNDQDRRAAYVWSVIPALMAWMTYILSPITAALALVLGFLLQYWRDVTLARKIAWPVWYLPLRIRLTLVAILSLFVGIPLPLIG
jgi:hypothetical protein